MKKKEAKSEKGSGKGIHSLRHQLILIIVGAVLFSILISALINGVFLERVYIHEKSEVLLKAREEIQKLDLEALIEKQESLETTNDEKEEEALESIFPDKLNVECSSNNLSWVVIRADNTGGLHWGENERKLQGKLFGYAYDFDTDKAQSTILKQADDYTIQKVRDHFQSMDFLECWGYFDGDYYYLIRTPLSAIQDSAKVSNRFYMLTGILTLLIGGLFVFVYTKRYTKPIEELTQLSQKMADLDFEAKYESCTGNEIDVLGESFNKMSKELKMTISELKAANLELQRDIDDKIKIDQMRKEFLDSVSHELKTPIAVIQGYAEGLKDGIVDDPESMDYYCDVIIDEAAKMNNMVKKLLTLNHLESGQDAPQMERFNLTELIQGVLQKMQLMIEEKNAKVIFDAEQDWYVWADDFQTEEVVTNYMSNALNHLDGERIITITVTKQEKRVLVTVANTGNPIPESDLPNLWIKFYKVDKARSREYGGSGIGLSIVKAIMNGMKQECGVENRTDGVAFWFTLDC
ncbi:MAG: HAMP domain-containing sensor histidine kinase [Eubacteriales bacterium]|nr:HAMP domain-containing sensor histidine kinase [Eubacteriales bacterium]